MTYIKGSLKITTVCYVRWASQGQSSISRPIGIQNAFISFRPTAASNALTVVRKCAR